jgi:8-amino-7-oxononanoate synthase
MDNSPFIDELTNLDTRGLRRQLRVKDNTLENFSSNDYLGLSDHSDVKAAAARAIEEFGVGGTSSRLLAGTTRLHRELEAELAAFFRKPAALAFSSGYHANTGIIPVLAGPGDALFVDRFCHASIIDGVRLSGARFYTFEHNDANDLSSLLAKHRAGKRRAIILTESIFSMDGDAAPLKRLADLSRAHDALLYVDEAHAIGIFGEAGRGWAEAVGVLDRVDVFVGTFSKSLGSQGGFVACSESLADLLISKSRAFIYTTALAPACAGAALAALRLLPSLDARREFVLEKSEWLRSGLRELGFSCLASSSQIVPVLTGEIEPAKLLSDLLLAQGFFVPSIRPPTVPAGQGRLRLSITFEAAQQGVERLSAAFAACRARPELKGGAIVKAR